MSKAPKDSRFKTATVIYVFLVGCVCLHFYRRPDWNMDMIGYMGNALMTNHTPIERAHKLVYAEIRNLPDRGGDALLGLSASADPTQDASRRARAEHVGNFAEFLPCFAIRPAYNQILFLASLVFGLTRAAILLAVVPYFALSLVVFRWASRYVDTAFAATFSLLLMLTPPIASIGRTPISDALSTLVAVSALYLIFEIKRDVVGVILLLATILVRSDNVVLVVPVLIALWLLRRLPFWQMTVLGVLSAGCVLFINRMAGDYGLAMLYYRNFVGTPIAPAEMVVHFSLADYQRAFRQNITVASQGWPIPFLLLAAIGYFRRSRLSILCGIALVYIALHLLILPNWVERWFVVAYIPMALSAVCVEDMLHKTVFHGIQESIGRVSTLRAGGRER
jgi:hypothetical protein